MICLELRLCGANGMGNGLIHSRASHPPPADQYRRQGRRSRLMGILPVYPPLLGKASSPYFVELDRSVGRLYVMDASCNL